MGITFDSEQLKAVEAKRNAVVMAGAGSGKTSVLAERFVWLLANRGAQIDEILALTFTQKAASEMYERIHARLREEGEAGVRHLADFDKAQISTVDSFCAQIARDAAGLFGLPPELRYDEQAVTRLASDLSLDFLLARSSDPAVRQLLRLYDFQTLWQGLFVSLAVDHFHLGGAEELTAMAERQIRECREALGERWEELQDPLASLLSLEARTRTIAANQQALRSLRPLPDLFAGERYGEAARLIGSCALKKPGGKAAEDLARMKELVDRLRSALADLEILALTLERREILTGAFALLEGFRRSFLERKRALGLVTFRDVAEMAVAALLRSPPLRQHYKRSFRHILIDEFQDNNLLQKKLLYLLAERAELCGDGVPAAGDLEPDKLFFVGDEKQSIYRFRGADVSVFASLNRELERSAGESLELKRNYRSLPGLIGFFNLIFARIMAGAARDFEARYRSMDPPPSAPALRAEIHLLVKPAPVERDGRGERLSGEEAEAYAVSRLIRETVAARSLRVPDRQGERPAGYGDFAVLLRSTGNQIHYERMFRHFSVPYSTANPRSLFLEAPAGDLYLLLRLAIYPEDRRAYAGLLRSPFVNLSDETLLGLLLPGGDPARFEPFAGSDAPWIPEQDRIKLHRARELYAFVRDRADRLSPTELIHRLWYEHGYRYFILRDPRFHNYLEYHDYLLKLAERSEAQGDTLAAFLEMLGENLGQYRRLEDLEILQPEERGVHLLTIHKSKGLEFPIVVLADTGNRGRGERLKSPYYLSDAFGITLNLGEGNFFSRSGEMETEAKEMAEARRLLYVAMTRARCHLILSGIMKRTGRRSERAHLSMILQGLGLSTQSPLEGRLPEGGDAWSLTRHRIPEVSREQFLASTVRPSVPKLEMIAAGYGGEPLARPARRREYSVSEVCALLESEGESVEERRVLPGLSVDPLLADQELERGFGTLTHFLLARRLEDPGGPLPPLDWTRLGIAAEHREACLRSAELLCRAFLDSQLGRLAAAAEREVELPFVYLWEGAGGPLYISGQIDLAFRAQGRTYLVDFKTDRSYRAGEYDAQLALYALAYRELSDLPLAAFVFLLRSGEPIAVERSFPWPELFARLPG